MKAKTKTKIKKKIISTKTKKKSFFQTFGDEKMNLDFLGINFNRNCVPQPALGLLLMSNAYYNVSSNAACVDALTSLAVEQVGDDGNTFKIVPTVSNPDQNQLDRLVRVLNFPDENQTISEIFTEAFRDLYGGITGNYAIIVNDRFVDGSGQNTIWGLRHIPSHLIYKASDKKGWYAKIGTKQVYFNKFGVPKDDENALTLFYRRIPYRGHSFQGVPPIFKTFDSATVQDAIVTTTRHYFKNGMQSHLVYQENEEEGTSDNSDVNQETIQSFFEKTLFGEERQFGVLYMHGAGKWDNLSQKLEGDTFDKIIRNTSQQIYDVHQCPVNLIGRLISGGSGFSELDSFRLYNRKKILPSKAAFSRDLQMLFGRGMGIFDWKIEFNSIDLTPASQDARTLIDLASALKSGIEAGFVDKENAKDIFSKTITDLKVIGGEK